MPRPLIGSTFGSTFRYLGFVLGSALPPSFDDSALLLFANGKNTDGTHKTDSINGYDMVAVEGPCLTLAIGDSIEMIGHGTFTSNTGTATFSTYDGTDLTCDGAGTAFELKFSDGTIWPCSEGAGDDEDNVTIHNTTGQHTGTITVADTPLAMWTDNTQDVYMDGNDRGWHGINAPDDDGIYYPADPTTEQLNMFQFEVVGDSALTVEGDDYEVGIHTVAGLSGGTPLTVVYGGADDQVVFTGDTVTGSGLDWSIDIDSSKVIVATMSERVTYELTLAVTGDSTCTIDGTDYTISGTPHTIEGLSGATTMAITYGGDDDLTEWSGADFGDVTGNAQTWSITMDGDKSISCDCSEDSGIVNLIVNGTFDTTVDDWTINDDTFTWQSGGTGRVTCTVNSQASAYQAATGIVNGTDYNYSIDVTALSTASTARLSVLGDSVAELRVGVGTYTGVITASSNLVRLMTIDTALNDWIEFDNVEIWEA